MAGKKVDPQRNIFHLLKKFKIFVRITVKKFLVFVPLFLSVACSSSTIIKSEPSGADISVDGRTVGKTPYTLEDSSIVYSTTRVSLSKPGYKLVNVTLCKNEKFNPYACIGIVTFPLWFLGYDETHMYTLDPEDNK